MSERLMGELGLTSYVEVDVLLWASESETEEQARELISEMSDGALSYLRLGAEKVVRFVLVEQGNRHRLSFGVCSGEKEECGEQART